MATTTAVTLETLDKELKLIRKELRKIKAFIEDPTGEKAEARSQNNGFKKPLQVSPELHAFLELPPGERISRADVTRRVSAYLEKNGLKNGQSISLDARLKDLLKVPDDVKLTFLNIQKWINPHFVKEPKPEKTKAPKEEAPKEKRKADAPAEEKANRPKVAKKTAVVA
jgi:upstream activation factor subunit UAF30